MKTAKLTVMFLACAAAIPAFAQNTTDSYCGTTNYDASRGMYTVVNPTGTTNQQCFVTVVPKESWTGGAPSLAGSQLVEGNYEVTLSGGGGGGGGGAGSVGNGTENAHPGDGGNGGHSAIPVTTVRYLNPGVYRLTIGAGGPGGMAGASGQTVASGGGNGADGAPTSLSNAYSGETLAGYHRAESWDGSYPLVALASYSGPPAPRGDRGPTGADSQVGIARPGNRGGDGFIRLALKDPVPQAAVPSSSERATPAPAAARPARRDRN